MKDSAHKSKNPGAFRTGLLFWTTAILFTALCLKIGFIGKIGEASLTLPWYCALPSAHLL